MYPLTTWMTRDLQEYRDSPVLNPQTCTKQWNIISPTVLVPTQVLVYSRDPVTSYLHHQY